MKYIFILSAIFMLASCQHKSSKEKAKEYWNNNQFELALIEISDAIKEHPDSSSFYTFRAAIYDIMSKYDAEINDLNKIIELNESEKSILFAYHQRAVAKLSLGLLEEALKDVDYFIAHQETLSDEEIAEAYINKASILYELNDKVRAKENYHLALSNENDNIKANAYVGLANLAENPQDALDLLNKAVKIAPDNVEALANMATIYLEQGDVERAYSNAKKSFTFDPYNAPNNFNIGQIYALYLNQPDSAKKYFERAIKIEPYSIKSVPAYINLAIIEGNSGNLQNAYKYAQKAVELKPEDDGIQYNVAQILSDIQKTKEALSAVSKAIEINPAEVEYYNLKGAILIDMQKFNEAIKVFHTCIEIEPNFGGAYYNLGYIYGEYVQHLIEEMHWEKDKNGERLGRLLVQIQEMLQREIVDGMYPEETRSEFEAVSDFLKKNIEIVKMEKVAEQRKLDVSVSISEQKNYKNETVYNELMNMPNNVSLEAFRHTLDEAYENGNISLREYRVLLEKRNSTKRT